MSSALTDNRKRSHLNQQERHNPLFYSGIFDRDDTSTGEDDAANEESAFSLAFPFGSKINSFNNSKTGKCKTCEQGCQISHGDLIAAHEVVPRTYSSLRELCAKCIDSNGVKASLSNVTIRRFSQTPDTPSNGCSGFTASLSNLTIGRSSQTPQTPSICVGFTYPCRHGKIMRHFSHQQLPHVYDPPITPKRSASLDDMMYRKCVSKIELIKTTLDQQQSTGEPTNPAASEKSPKAPRRRSRKSKSLFKREGTLSAAKLLFVMLTTFAWAIGFALTMTHDWLAALKSIADKWLSISWTICKSMYHEQRLGACSMLLMIPFVLLSGLVYGVLCMLLVANRVLLIRGDRHQSIFSKKINFT